EIGCFTLSRSRLFNSLLCDTDGERRGLSGDRRQPGDDEDRTRDVAAEVLQRELRATARVNRQLVDAGLAAELNQLYRPLLRQEVVHAHEAVGMPAAIAVLDVVLVVQFGD